MFSKRVSVIALMCLLTVAFAAAGCGKSAGQDQSTADQGTALAGSLQMAGSTSVQPLAEELASAFMEKNTGVKIDVQGGGSSVGIKSAVDGIANIGMASRELKPEEKSQGLTATVIAKDGIAVIVNPANKVAALKIDDIKKIFTGEITNWKEIGGSDASVVVINREEGSGTRDAFQELVLGKEAKFTDKSAIQNSTGAVRTAVAGDPNAVGFISMGSLDETVKALKVDGTEPTEASVLNGSYKISRPFNLLTKGEPTDLSKAFIDWILSAEGQKIVGEEFVPLKK